jgi:hypothetical protein
MSDQKIGQANIGDLHKNKIASTFSFHRLFNKKKSSYKGFSKCLVNRH